MAVKRSAASLQSSLEALDARIADREQLLKKDRENRRRLLAQIARAQAAELMDIIEDRELSFELAKEILSSAAPEPEAEDELGEEVTEDEQEPGGS